MTDNEKNMENEVESTVQAEVSSEAVMGRFETYPVLLLLPVSSV